MQRISKRKARVIKIWGYALSDKQIKLVYEKEVATPKKSKDLKTTFLFSFHPMN